MKILFNEKEREVIDFYKEVAEMLSQEPVGDVDVKVPGMGSAMYKISMRSGTPFITEVFNNLPDNLLPDHYSACFLTCINPDKNAYKFYKLEQIGSVVRASYGRMGVQKGELFGERSYDYPLSMYWIKYMEKIAKGYVDRTELYLAPSTPSTPIKSEQPDTEKKGNPDSMALYELLHSFAKRAVECAKVQVPITGAIIKHSKELLGEMKKAKEVNRFNDLLLELMAILQRPVQTGDGTGVKRLMAQTQRDFRGIIEREDDLICAMEGVLYGQSRHVSGDFHNIFVRKATERQKEQVLSKLSPSLRGKVRNVYRVIPKEQKKRFDEYVKNRNIKTVKQFWHGSRNQNWLSIVNNSLLLNPDAIITGKMYGNGIYFAPDSLKSWGYTSRGKWTGGSSSTCIMGLYATAYGDPLDVSTWSCSADYQKMVEQSGKDCLHAHGGSALRADEIIFYDEAAVLLQYIVEFDA